LDNLTHSLFGITLARTPLGRAGRGTTAALLLASNVPDIDILASARGAAGYLAWHRGPTHGPIGIVGLAVLTAGIVRAGQYLNPRWPDEAPDAPFPMLVALSAVGIVFHLLMDLPTSYGLRFLSPFNWHWFAVDWLPIIDVYLLLVLVAGLIFGRSSAEAMRRNAVIALILVAMNYGFRGAAHHRALTVAPRLFGPTLPRPCPAPPPPHSALDEWPRPAAAAQAEGSRCLVEIAAIPTVSPFSWTVVARMSNAYELHNLNLLDERLRDLGRDDGIFWRRVTRYPNIWTPAVEAAASTRIGQLFLGFSRFPDARSAVDAQGVTVVRFTDMRFVEGPLVIGEPRARSNLFSAVVRIDRQGQVLSQSLGR
jgi:membrane-bound metal-dependent hydrolase YbcI (DUF457 family)